MPDRPSNDDPTLQRLMDKSQELKEQSEKLNSKVGELQKLIKSAAVAQGKKTQALRKARDGAK